MKKEIACRLAITALKNRISRYEYLLKRLETEIEKGEVTDIEVNKTMISINRNAVAELDQAIAFFNEELKKEQSIAFAFSK